MNDALVRLMAENATLTTELAVERGKARLIPRAEIRRMAQRHLSAIHYADAEYQIIMAWLDSLEVQP